MSLWKDYFEEKGLLVVENEKGFMSAYIHEGTCMVDNFYVRPENRGTTAAAYMALKMVKLATERGCTLFCAEIYKSDPMYNYILQLHLKFGMEIAEDTEFKTVTGKDIKKECKYDRRERSIASR